MQEVDDAPARTLERTRARARPAGSRSRRSRASSRRASARGTRALEPADPLEPRVVARSPRRSRRLRRPTARTSRAPSSPGSRSGRRSPTGCRRARRRRRPGSRAAPTSKCSPRVDLHLHVLGAAVARHPGRVGPLVVVRVLVHQAERLGLAARSGSCRRRCPEESTPPERNAPTGHVGVQVDADGVGEQRVELVLERAAREKPDARAPSRGTSAARQ